MVVEGRLLLAAATVMIHILCQIVHFISIIRLWFEEVLHGLVPSLLFDFSFWHVEYFAEQLLGLHELASQTIDFTL